MPSVATTTLVIASFLVLVSVVQPAAERLRLPYAVLLAVVGVAVGGVASFLLYSPSITLFDDVVGPIVNLPFSASIFLVVFLPVLLFHAALMIDVREIADDAATMARIKIGGRMYKAISKRQTLGCLEVAAQESVFEGRRGIRRFEIALYILRARKHN